ncbi:sugar ABC transporter ATP-binding protein [Niallia nealsonii]|uniref:Lipase n=1 Tax=Niallia nealsonii TaxID=115979 RepID=A0A2N0Z6X1_9BACI|nr:sugar ABC transporter ATP-binding protein [Niallia nealsonii]PKG25261.1 lipase [Niallia nealsonii]
MKKPLIKITNLSKSFSGVKALQQVSITINEGEVRCLAGENGCGKSTLIKMISGFYQPDEGSIEINGNSYKNLSPMDAIKEGIQVIYQDFSIFPNLTVAENIALNVQLAQNKRVINWKYVYKVAEEAINKVGINIDLSAKVETLSVADKQLVAISRAILQNAKLIIMDEPTTALTQKEVKSLFSIINELKKEGISILFVSHKLDEVYEICDKITILRNGKNVKDGDIQEIERRKLVEYMTGREIEDNFYQPSIQKDKALLKVDRLSKENGFNDISFELYPGEIMGITGLLGSGRTELAKSLFGLLPVDSGSIFIEEKQVKIKNVHDAIKHQIGYVPEDRLTEGLFLSQSIGKNIVVSVIDRILKKSKLVDNKKMNHEMDKWITDLTIKTPSHKLPVQVLSGGNQQRVVLAKWLATNPKILILNGPTVGVDIGSKAEIHRIIREFAGRGVGVIVISDDISEVIHNCNRILVMKKGKIVNEFQNTAITEQELGQQLSS